MTFANPSGKILSNTQKPISPENASIFIFYSPDYDKINPGDKISLKGLAGLAPGKQVDCVVTHAGGKTTPIKLNHSLNQGQIEWFKAGSALNYMKQANK